MNKIQELLATGEITLEDIEEYLESQGKTSINTDILDILESYYANRPG